MPTISEEVTIDGYTQPGASVNTLAAASNAVLQIELDGTNAVGGNGLMIQVGTATTATTVRGLVIIRFSGDGIQVFQGPTTGIVIAGNFIGTDAAGALDRGNVSAGIRLLEAAGVHIGGTEPGARNEMSVQDFCR